MLPGRQLSSSGAVALFVGVFAYGHDGIFSRMAIADPVLIAAGRFTVAALVVWPIAWWFHGPALRAADGRTILLTFAAGACLGIDLALWVAASQRTSIANSLVLAHLTPVWLLIAAIASQRARPSGRSVLMVVASLAGAIIVSRDSLGATIGNGFAGDLLAVSSSLFTAIYLLLSRAAGNRLATLPFLAWTFSWAALLLGAGTLVHGALPPSLDGRTLLGIVGMGLVGQLIGQGLIVFSLRTFTPGFVAVSCLAEPVVGALLALAYLGEALPLSTVAGGAVILLGIHQGMRVRH
jgi:drug/metabolite transporter (DMT)-like permease